MGASGTAMTVTSHLLMSLSRSPTSRSRQSDESQSRRSQNRKEAESRVNLNFKNERDNICNLAITYKLMSDEFCQPGIWEDSKMNAKSSEREKYQHRQGDTNAQDAEIKNYLTNTTIENTKSQNPSRMQTSRAVPSHPRGQKHNLEFAN